jgi:hypothetical protein
LKNSRIQIMDVAHVFLEASQVSALAYGAKIFPGCAFEALLKPRP